MASLSWIVGVAGLSALGAACWWLAAPLRVAMRSAQSPWAPSEERYEAGDGSRAFGTLFDPASVRLSLIVPAYNEEERLPVMLDETMAYLRERRARDAAFSFEVIIVDDGSSDGTAAVALEASRRYGADEVRLMRLAENHGKGGAVRKGMLRASGELLLMVDADGATQFSDLERLERRLAAQGGRGVVVGSRAHLADDAVAKRAWYRSVLMYGFHAYVATFGVRGVQDTQCGFKLFARDAAQRLFPPMHLQRWAFDVELLMLATRLGIPVAEEAVTWQEVDGSHLNLAAATVEMARDILMIRVLYTTGVWSAANGGGAKSCVAP